MNTVWTHRKKANARFVTPKGLPFYDCFKLIFNLKLKEEQKKSEIS